ncbi:hypothetical protein APA12_40326 (plasmid) [Acetobacter pasteurianus IFO 3283-12]|nr:hypothetical protein APA12_40326 [Acetobacter pasteurianus IFO 3283-12]
MASTNHLRHTLRTGGSSVLLSFCPSVLLSFCPSVLLSFCPSVLLSFCPMQRCIGERNTNKKKGYATLHSLGTVRLFTSTSPAIDQSYREPVGDHFSLPLTKLSSCHLCLWFPL